MELEGAKRVDIAGKDDKRQITALFAAGSMVYLSNCCIKERHHVVFKSVPLYLKAGISPILLVIGPLSRR